MRARIGWALLSMSVWLGCDGGVATIDGGGGMDAAGPRDASLDGAAFDGAAFDGATIDGATIDGAAIADTSLAQDVSVDAGTLTSDDGGLDATALVDAALVDASVDAGRDASSAMDAATDAAVTTCAVFVSPAVGATTDTFTVTLASNGASCTLSVDGTPLSVPCTITTEVVGSLFSPGTHTLSLDVGSGPAGPTTCGTTVVVTPGPDAGPVDAGPAVTTCSLAITPPSATSDDELTLEAASNGSGCEIAVDGGARMSVPCTFTYASRLPAGDHLVVMYVGAGPAGPTSCMAGVTVVDAPDAGPRDAGPPGTTTCTIDVSPAAGAVGDTYTLSWDTNGSGCSLRLDGGASLVVPCSTTTTTSGSTFGAGAHTLELVVSAGPGGATSCADGVTVAP